jgi:hypothetical protein
MTFAPDHMVSRLDGIVSVLYYGADSLNGITNDHQKITDNRSGIIPR